MVSSRLVPGGGGRRCGSCRVSRGRGLGNSVHLICNVYTIKVMARKDLALLNEHLP